MDSKERIYTFSLRIIRFVNQIPRNIASEVLTKQLIRSATSIGANVVEAKGSFSRKDFTNYFHYALKSSNETKYWLELIRDSQKVDISEICDLISEVEQISKILASSILTLKAKK